MLWQCAAANGFASLPGRTPAPFVVDSVEIMLALAPHGAVRHTRGTPPFSLTFFKDRQGQLTRYDICPADRGSEGMITAQIEDIIPVHRVIVFLLEELAQRKYLATNCECCYAVWEESTFRFYQEEDTT